MKNVKTEEIRYDEIRTGDMLAFHGAKVIVTETHTTPAPANEYYPNEKTIRFTIKPADEEAIKILGKFYSHGTYGGVGCLRAEKIVG